MKIKNKNYNLPIFLPDATRAVTKSIDSSDLKNVGVRGVVVNTYHLATSPGTEVLKSVNGIKNFMNFDGLVVSDSGGWQVFSLIHRNKSGGKITDQGVEFVIGKGKKDIFTPEESIKTQFEIGSDIVICLDDFTPPDADQTKAAETVDRTLLWAKACKDVYLSEIKKRKLTEKTRPHLFSVIQGGYFKKERKRCAEGLLEIGFDGYGYGGYVIRENGKLDLDLSKYIANLIPNDKPKFALGLGRPDDVVELYKMGWNIFDCTLPTRDARHRRLYKFIKDPKKINFKRVRKFYDYLYIDRSNNEKNFKPISKYCDCHTCTNYSKSYLKHLFKIGDVSALRLATIHNLRFYTQLLNLLKAN